VIDFTILPSLGWGARIIGLLTKFINDNIGDRVDNPIDVSLGGIERRGNDDMIAARAVGCAAAWIDVDLVVWAQRCARSELEYGMPKDY
jgi:hypothetical protein